MKRLKQIYIFQPTNYRKTRSMKDIEFLKISVAKIYLARRILHIIQISLGMQSKI